MIDLNILTGPGHLLRLQHAAVVDGPRSGAVRAYRAALQGDPCCFCGRRPRSTIDHIVPRSKDGTDEPGNGPRRARLTTRQGTPGACSCT